MTEKGRDSGTTTAETAVALPALALLLAMAVWAVSAAGAQIRCTDAARLGARAAARGEPIPWVRAVATRAAPDRAEVTVGRDATSTRVSVAAPVPPPLAGDLRALVVSAQAVARTEPSAGDSPPAPASRAQAATDTGGTQ